MKRKKTGFTLIEMIITLALTVIILGIASFVFITGNRVFSDSDVKSTLQIEGQVIQEKISDIGMQGSGIENIPTLGDVIKSYNKDGEDRYFKFERNGNELYIIEYSINDKNEIKFENKQLISKNTIKFEPIYSDNSAEFNIELSLKKVNYPINVKVNFRNKK